MLPLILLVWGFVFSQRYGYFFSEPTFVHEQLEEKVNISEIKQDTFSIVADYRDPFLGKRITLKKRTYLASTTNKNSSRKKTVNPEMAWPTITYNGMIKNNNSDRRVGIVKVNGNEYLVKEKDVVSEITIVSIGKNSVNVRFQKENRTITK